MQSHALYETDAFAICSSTRFSGETSKFFYLSPCFVLAPYECVQEAELIRIVDSGFMSNSNFELCCSQCSLFSKFRSLHFSNRDTHSNGGHICFSNWRIQLDTQCELFSRHCRSSRHRALNHKTRSKSQYEQQFKSVKFRTKRYAGQFT